jgi:hypothetical protein
LGAGRMLQKALTKAGEALRFSAGREPLPLWPLPVVGEGAQSEIRAAGRLQRCHLLVVSREVEERRARRGPKRVASKSAALLRPNAAMSPTTSILDRHLLK